MKTTTCATLLFMILLLSSFQPKPDYEYPQKYDTEYSYIFQLQNITTPGDAKTVNDIVIRPAFNKVASFIDETDKFELVIIKDLQQDDFKSIFNNNGYVMKSFEKNMLN